MRVSVWRQVKAQEDFKWRGWSNVGKNQNPENSLGLPTKPKTITGPQKNIRSWMFVFVSSSYHLKLSYASTTANLKIVLMNPKKSLIKSSHPKKSLPHFPTPKNLGNENFKPQKSFDYPCHLKSEHLLTDVFSFSAANTLIPSIMPYPAKWIEAPPFLSPLKTPYKDV